MSATVVVGATYVDTCFDHAQLPTMESPTSFAARAVTCFGGKGYNQAVAARRLAARDTRVVFLTSIGRGGREDPMSEAVVETLTASENFAPEDVFAWIDASCSLPPVAILTDGNDVRMISVTTGDLPAGPVELLATDDQLREAITKADALTVTCDYGEHFLSSLLEACKQLNPDAPRVLNPAPAFGKLYYVSRETLRGFDWLTPNEREARFLLADMKSELRIEKLTKGLARIAQANVCVTRGRDGYVHSEFNGSVAIPVASHDEVMARDSTGASDAFSAALAVWLADGADIATARLAARAAGALATETLGTSVSMPFRKAVEDLIKDATK